MGRIVSSGRESLQLATMLVRSITTGIVGISLRSANYRIIDVHKFDVVKKLNMLVEVSQTSVIVELVNYFTPIISPQIFPESP
jgi:hypothetical protein